MITRSPLEHFHTIIDSRMLGNPGGFCPNDAFIVAAQRTHFSLEFVSMLRNRSRKHAESEKENSND